MAVYMFGSAEQIQYQRNLNRAGFSWDPHYFRLYTIDQFKHTFFRYWRITIFGFLDCLLSWLSVCARIYRIIKLREVNAMLTPEQKQAGFALRTRDLSRDEVFQKLKILDPEIREPGNFRLVGVDSDEFSHVFAKALVDSQARDIIVPLFQASGMNVTKREMVFLKYAVGDDPDNINLNKLIEEYRSSDVPMQESEIFLEQLKIMRTFAKNASDKQLGD